MSLTNQIGLFIVIPVYGNWPDTIECLRALKAQTVATFQVLVADDGSPTPPPVELHEFEFAEYQRGPNVGFAANCNRTAQIAIAKGATHLLFLNNDTLVSPGFIQGALRVLAEIPHAIVSPLVYWFRDPSSVWCSGGKLTMWIPYLQPSVEYQHITEVDIVSGCAMFVPVTEWKILNGFDEAFAMYFEDFDLTLRAKARGIQTFVVPGEELRVWHKVGGSFREDGMWPQHYALVTSRLIFIRTHYRGAKRQLGLILAFGHQMWLLLRSLPRVPSARQLYCAISRGFQKV